MATWRLTRYLRPPRQVVGGPGPRFDRADRWLYDRYGLGVTDRQRVLNAVLGGRELHEQPLRQAAHGLAAAILGGKTGILYRRAGWIRICSGLTVTVTAVVVAATRDFYAIIAVVLVGLPQLLLGWLYQKAIRRRVEQAHRLNAWSCSLRSPAGEPTPPPEEPYQPPGNGPAWKPERGLSTPMNRA